MCWNKLSEILFEFVSYRNDVLGPQKVTIGNMWSLVNHLRLFTILFLLSAILPLTLSLSLCLFFFFFFFFLYSLRKLEIVNEFLRPETCYFFNRVVASNPYVSSSNLTFFLSAVF